MCGAEPRSSFKPWKPGRPNVECRDRVNPHTPFTMRAALVKRDHRRLDLDQVAEIVAIADPRQTHLPLGGREAWQIVDRLGFETPNVAPCSFAEWCVVEELGR